MNFDSLNNDNFSFYLMKTYDNPQCRNLQEFWDDVNRIKYLKRLFRRYKDKGILKERLILNHLITFYNVFLPEHATRILFYKLEPDLWQSLSSFLYFLNYLPDEVKGVSEDTIHTSNIVLDMKILETLEKL